MAMASGFVTRAPKRAEETDKTVPGWWEGGPGSGHKRDWRQAPVALVSLVCTDPHMTSLVLGIHSRNPHMSRRTWNERL
jgi:hypothetical protein